MSQSTQLTENERNVTTERAPSFPSRASDLSSLSTFHNHVSDLSPIIIAQDNIKSDLSFENVDNYLAGSSQTVASNLPQKVTSQISGNAPNSLSVLLENISSSSDIDYSEAVRSLTKDTIEDKLQQLNENGHPSLCDFSMKNLNYKVSPQESSLGTFPESSRSTPKSQVPAMLSDLDAAKKDDTLASCKELSDCQEIQSRLSSSKRIETNLQKLPATPKDNENVNVSSDNINIMQRIPLSSQNGDSHAETKKWRSPRLAAKVSTKQLDLMNLLNAQILTLGQSLSVGDEEAYLTKDAWIEYGSQRFPSLSLWFAALGKKLGWSKKKIQETDPWDTVVVDNSYPLSFFRNQLAEVIKKSGNVSRQKGSRRINFEEIEQSDKFVTMTQSSIHSLFPSLQPNKKRRLNNSDFEWSETKKQNSEFNRKKNKKRKKSHKIRQPQQQRVAESSLTNESEKLYVQMKEISQSVEQKIKETSTSLTRESTIPWISTSKRNVKRRLAHVTTTSKNKEINKKNKEKKKADKTQWTTEIGTQKRKLSSTEANSSEITNTSIESEKFIRTPDNETSKQIPDSLQIEGGGSKKSNQAPNESPIGHAQKGAKIPAKIKETSMAKTGPSLPPLILGSGLKSTMLYQIKELTKKLGGHIVKEFTEQFTHLVVLPNDKNRANRTLKYLAAVLKGCWIVSYKWVLESQREQTWLPEAPYEVRGDGVALGAPEKARKYAQTHGESMKLFKNYRLYFAGEFKTPSPAKTEFEKLVEIGGGTALSNPPSPPSNLSDVVDCKTLILCDSNFEADECKKLLLQTGRRPLSLSWFLDSISFFQIQPTQNYKMSISTDEEIGTLMETQQSLSL